MPVASPGPNQDLDAEIRLAGAVWRADAESTRLAAQAVNQAQGKGVAHELLRVLHLFVGFPRVVAALNAVHEAGPDSFAVASDPCEPSASDLSAPLGIDADFSASTHEERLAAGEACFARFYGEQAQKVLTHLKNLDPLFRNYIVEHAYGRILARPRIPIATKERLALLCLAASLCWKQWESHARIALREGVTIATLQADLQQSSSWIDTESIQQAAQCLDSFAQGDCA